MNNSKDKQLNPRAKKIAAAICAIALICLYVTVNSFVADRASQSALAQASTLSGTQPRYYTESLDDEVFALQSSWENVVSIDAGNANFHYHSGRASMVAALVAPDPNYKTELICESFYHFRTASQLSPLRADLQVAWADISAQVPKPELLCSGGDSELAFEAESLSASERLDWAQKLAPHSGVNLYLASIVRLALKDKDRALSTLKHIQEVYPFFSRGQRDYAYSLVTSEEDLKIAIPQTYPSALAWTLDFFQQRPEDYEAWHSVFEEAMLSATNEVVQRFRGGKLRAPDYSRFMKLIAQSPMTATSEKLRRRSDELLASIYKVERNPRWGKVLAARSTLSRIPVPKSLIIDDRSPKSTMLYAWVPDRETRIADLDVIGRSAGVYIPRGKNAEMLIFKSQGTGGRLSGKSFELLASDDNLNFHSYRSPYEIEPHYVDGNEVLVVKLSRSDFRYLKIRYTGSNQKPRFKNYFADLIQVYGSSVS